MSEKKEKQIGWPEFVAYARYALFQRVQARYTCIHAILSALTFLTTERVAWRSSGSI